MPRSGCFRTSAVGISVSRTGGITHCGARNLGKRQPVVIGRQHHHQRDLHQFGRLQPQRTEVDPALRAHADGAHHLDQNEKPECPKIGKPRHRPPEPDRHHGDDHHRHHTHHKPLHLRFGPAPGLASGDRGQHQKADAGHSGQQQHQRPVHIKNLADPGRDRVNLVDQIGHARLALVSGLSRGRRTISSCCFWIFSR